MRKKRKSEREIGRCPEVVNQKRRDACKYDLLLFLKTYFPATYCLPFADRHLKVIEIMQSTILEGGQFCLAMPRGDGKTSITEGATIFAVAYGHRRFIVPIGANETAACSILDSIKVEFETNDLLFDDFPEICFPVSKLEGISLRGVAQTCEDVRTRIEWKGARVILPTVPGSVSAGSIIWPRGLTGGIRGMSRKLDTGEKIRPDLVILDDPQDDESAKSPTQCDKRLELVTGAVLGLAGPNEKIAAVMTCTVIEKEDLADQLLDKELHPEWHGQRFSLVEKWPDNLDIWNQDYAEKFRNDLRDGLENHPNATRFYEENREEMERGSIVGWDHRKHANELSALQHAFNLKIRVGEKSFFSEYQNKPKSLKQSLYSISVDFIMSRTNGLKVHQIPEDAHFKCLGIDINDYGLSWCKSGFRNDFGGFVSAYGVYPDYQTPLWQDGSSVSIQQAIFKGILELVVSFKGQAINMVLIDGNYETDTVYKAVIQLRNTFFNQIFPCRGWPAKRYRPKGERDKRLIGKERARCRMQTSERGCPEVIFDSHFWHMTTQKAFLLAPNSAGSLSFYGDNSANHRIIAEHVCADKLRDYYIRHGEEKYDWATIGKNDLGDAIAMSAVGANIAGASLDAQAPQIRRKKKRPKRKSKVQIGG